MDRTYSKWLLALNCFIRSIYINFIKLAKKNAENTLNVYTKSDKIL